MLRPDGLRQSINGVDTVDLIAVEADVGEIDAEAFFKEKHNLDRVDGLKTTAEQQGVVVGEGTAIFLAGEKVLHEISDIVFFGHGKS
jgi:hypothetical protein